MKNKLMKIKNILNNFIPSICIVIFLLLLYIVKKIFPFGNETISNGDLGQSYVPFYYLLYDILHFSKNIFYDFYLGPGTNIYGGIVIDGLLNPSVWWIGLVNRYNIVNVMSINLIVKISFITLTSYILFNKLYPNTK